MMFNSTLSAILRGNWLLEEQFVNTHLPLVAGFLNGSISGQEFLKGNGEMELPFYLQKDGSRKDAYVRGYNGLIFNPDSCTPGSIAVVPFVGPLTKYDGTCGEPGMIKRQTWIVQMTAQNGCVGYMSIMDCPGGQADGTPQTAKTIQNLKMPTAAVIVGCACSGGAWIASGHDKIYVADEFGEFGSIGAYRTIVDPTGAYEKEGYKVITIYPPQSKEKNSSYRKALAGDLTEATEEIGGLASTFVEAFKANRGDRITSDDFEFGKVFNAADSIRIGLIDGIKTLPEVALEMRSGSKNYKSVKKQNSDTMEFKNLNALAGVQKPTNEQLNLANAELTIAGVLGATLVSEETINDAVAVTAQLSQVTSELGTVKGDLATANASILAKDQEIQTLNDKVAAFGKNAGAIREGAEGDDTAGDEDSADDSAKTIAALPHNKAANEALGN